MSWCLLKRNYKEVWVNLLKFNTELASTRAASVLIPEVKKSKANSFNKKRKILKTLFGLSPSVLKVLSQTKKLEDVNSSELSQIAAVLQRVRIHPHDVQDCTDVFTLPVNQVKQYAEFLRELGTEQINGKMIAGFPKLVNQPCKLFKAYLNLPDDTSILNNIISVLPSEVQASLRKHGNCYDREESTFQSLWNEVLFHYLEMKLEVDKEKIKKFTEKNSLGELPRSLRQLDNTINELLELNFSCEEILQENHLLLSQPRAIVETFRQYPELTSGNTMDFLRSNLQVFSMNPDFVVRNLATVTRLKVPVEPLLKNLEILNEVPEVLKEQLEQVAKIPGHEAFYFNPYFLKRLKHIDQLESRAKALMSVDPRHISVSVLVTCTDKRFDEIVHCGKQLRIPLEVLYYLAHHTASTKEEIFNQLHSFISWQQINLPNIVQVVEFLQRQECTKEQIFHGLFLVLYPYKVVERIFLRVPVLYSSIYPKVSNKEDPALLKIAHYYLEKDYSFSGCGVYSSDDLNDYDAYVSKTN